MPNNRTEAGRSSSKCPECTTLSGRFATRWSNLSAAHNTLVGSPYWLGTRTVVTLAPAIRSKLIKQILRRCVECSVIHSTL
jgi:hypothetical protein